FMNPYVGLRRDGSGYYLVYAEASSSPYYRNDIQRKRLAAANQGGRVDLTTFSPYGGAATAYDNKTGTETPVNWGQVRSIIDGMFKGQSYGRADRQYASDKEVARIAQEGRDQIKQAQLSSEIGYAQDAARRAAEDQQRSGTTPGGPDVQLTTGGDNGDALDDGGRGGARRRRGAYQGSGLKI